MRFCRLYLCRIMGVLTWPTKRVTISKLVPLSVFFGGGFIFLLNAAVEVKQVHTLPLARELKDDASQRPLESKKKKNPWDEP
ncbi:MAG: hypothetical protein IAF94_10460 [Pirellulaceae bacterium]|nr:hypothetical protein [Pirellulaceae bacterium]